MGWGLLLMLTGGTQERRGRGWELRMQLFWGRVPGRVRLRAAVWQVVVTFHGSWLGGGTKHRGQSVGLSCPHPVPMSA